MQAKNFKWAQGIYVHVEGEELDLHNDYDFLGLSYDVKARYLALTWRRGTGHWVNPRLPYQLRMNMTGIHHFRFAPRDADSPFTEDDCLAGFGYNGEQDWMDGQFSTDGPPEPDWYWSFEFHSGAEIVVGGEAATVELLPHTSDDQPD